MVSQNFFVVITTLAGLEDSQMAVKMTCRVDPPRFGINYGSVSFGQLSGYIVFCILLIVGASPPVWVLYKVQCSQKVGQKKWSHNFCQSWEDLPYMSFYSTFVNPLQVQLLLWNRVQVYKGEASAVGHFTPPKVSVDTIQYSKKAR